MQWIKKIRRSAYFVDALLVAGAIVAIVGLATYVRLHASKTTAKQGPTTQLSYLHQYLPTLEPISQGQPADAATDSTPGQSTTPTVVLGAQTTAPSANPSPITPPADTPVTPKPACDEPQKSKLLAVFTGM